MQVPSVWAIGDVTDRMALTPGQHSRRHLPQASSLLPALQRVSDGCTYIPFAAGDVQAALPTLPAGRQCGLLPCLAVPPGPKESTCLPACLPTCLLALLLPMQWR